MGSNTLPRVTDDYLLTLIGYCARACLEVSANKFGVEVQRVIVIGLMRHYGGVGDCAAAAYKPSKTISESELFSRKMAT